MDGEKCPPYAPPSSVVDPDIGTPDPPRVGEEILGINTETQGCLPWKMTEEVQEGELWTVDWWDDVREDRSKSEEEVRPLSRDCLQSVEEVVEMSQLEQHMLPRASRIGSRS
jgi:hypothetical protein